MSQVTPPAGRFPLRIGIIFVVSSICGISSAQAPANVDRNATSRPAAKFESGRLTPGTVTLKNFLQMVQLLTGATIIFPASSSDDGDRTFELLAPIEPFTFEVARSFLRANGYDLVRRDVSVESGIHFELQRLPGNTAQSAASSGSVPNFHPVATDTLSLSRLDPRWTATLILTLEHIPSDKVAPVLRDLFDTAGGRGSELNVIVGSTQMIVVRGPVDVLRHVGEVIALVDRPQPVADGRLFVRELQFADVTETVELLREALIARATQRQGSRGNTGKGPSRPVETKTTLIGDPRTQKILIQTTDSAELGLVLGLIEELDLKATRLLADTHVYHAKYLKASALHATVQALLDGTPLGERYRLVPHDASNSILIRGPEEGRLTVLNFLIEADQSDEAAEETPESAYLYEVRPFPLRYVSASIAARVLSDYLREIARDEIEVFARVVSVPGRQLLIFRSPRRDRIKELEGLARTLDDPRFQLGIYDELFLWKSKRRSVEIAVDLQNYIEETDFPVTYRVASADRIAIKVDRELRTRLLETLLEFDRE